MDIGSGCGVDVCRWSGGCVKVVRKDMGDGGQGEETSTTISTIITASWK